MFLRFMQIVSIGDNLHWRQFVWNVKSYFLKKIKKNITNLSSAELAQSDKGLSVI